MSPSRRDVGKAYLDALDKKPKPPPEVADDSSGEEALLAGEGPRQNGVSYGTRRAIRRLLAEAEEEFHSRQKVRPRRARRFSWLAIAAASALSCALGFVAGRWSDATPPPQRAVQTMTIPPGHYYCARCQLTHVKPEGAVGNPRTWCPKLAAQEATSQPAPLAPAIPERAKRFRSGTRLP